MKKDDSLLDFLTKRELRILVEDGNTDEDIANQFHVSPATVERRRRALGIVRPTLTRPLAEYNRMKERGLSDKDIMYIWDMPRHTFSCWKSRNKTPRLVQYSQKQK